ncbi:MAG TPA: T9SS type A sorting domain-containing protein [bacterium]|jgi:hypothetical protein
MRLSRVLWVLLLPVAVFAQLPDTVWTRGYEAYYDSTTSLVSITGTQDNGLAVVGYCCRQDTINLCDALLLKANADGQFQWSEHIAGGGVDVFDGVTPTRDGGFFACGHTSLAGLGWMVLAVKYSAAGDTEWVRTTNPHGSMVTDALELAGGDLVATGELIGPPSYSGAPGLVRFTPQGDTLFTRRYPHSDPVHWGSAFSDARSAVETRDQGVLLMTGINGGSVWRHDCTYLVRTNAEGDSMWTRTLCLWGQDSTVMPLDICRADSDSYMMAAAVPSPDSASEALLLLVKLNDLGDTVWTRTYDFPDYSLMAGGAASPVQIVHDPSGGFVVSATYFEWPSQRSVGTLIKVDLEGAFLWMGTYSMGQPLTQANHLSLAADSTYLWLLQDNYYADHPQKVLRLHADSANAAPPPPLHPVATFRLMQNYPNPFNPSTEIAFELPREMRVTLKVFDVLGREVARLKDGVMAAGEHRIVFDGTNLPSGVYFYRMDTNQYVQTRKMLLLK